MTEVGIGAVIDGRYKILSRLGSGGMADVYLAEDQQLGRKIALKLLHRRFSADPDFVERFRREAQAAAGLQHPNVVGVYDRGSHEETYFIAMEYLPGRSLKQLIRQEAPLDPVRAIDITVQILKAARFAHRRGVIHRDLKPHNVIVDEGDHAKVTDFGIARAGASDMTETGSIMGTAQYLSPEQAQGHAVSPASDLYSIAVVLYELLTGRVPFDAESAVTIAIKHVSEPPTAPTVVNPNIPPELEQVVMWALNKNPADRPQDADQFITALEQAKEAILSPTRGQRTASMAALAAVGAYQTAVASAAPPAQAPPPIYDAPDGNGAGVLVDDTIPPGERKRDNRWAWIALIVALLIVGGAVAAFLLTRSHKILVRNVVGETLGVASTQLQNDGFAVSTINLPSSHPAGIVFRQSPQGGTKAEEGSTITLTVSSGPGNATVPSVEGLPLAQAKAQIIQAGLKPGRVVKQSSDQVAAGSVVATDPGAGASPPVGTKVTIFVSSGHPLASVPDVRGLSVSDAKAALRSAGFTNVSTTDQTSSTVPDGHVINQDPAPNSQVPTSKPITLVVAKAPTTAMVPDVKGQTPVNAAATLTAAGFKVVQQTKNVSKQSQDGIVIRQTPSAGTTVNKGTTVTIVVGHYTAPPPTSSTTSTTPTTSTTTTGP